MIRVLFEIHDHTLQLLKVFAVGGIFLRDWKLQYGSSLSAAGKSAYYPGANHREGRDLDGQPYSWGWFFVVGTYYRSS
jgi:hypothetical protein